MQNLRRRVYEHVIGCVHEATELSRLLPHCLKSRLFMQVTDLYVRWEYAAKQAKKVAALLVLKKKATPAGSVLEADAAEMVSTRRAITDISELVDGARVALQARRGGAVLALRGWTRGQTVPTSQVSDTDEALIRLGRDQ